MAKPKMVIRKVFTLSQGNKKLHSHMQVIPAEKNAVRIYIVSKNCTG